MTWSHTELITELKIKHMFFQIQLHAKLIYLYGHLKLIRNIWLILQGLNKKKLNTCTCTHY